MQRTEESSGSHHESGARQHHAHTKLERFEIHVASGEEGLGAGMRGDLRVFGVLPDSRMEAAGLMVGDTITSIDGTLITSLVALRRRRCCSRDTALTRLEWSGMWSGM
eukprot:2481485-Prymnesium_polylepis.1